MTDGKHAHTIFIVGTVSREPKITDMKNGGQCGRVEITCTVTYKENTSVQKYTIVTYSKTLIEAVFSKMVVGTEVAAGGKHSMVERTWEGKTWHASEISIPSPHFGGMIHILSNNSSKFEQNCEDIEVPW